MEDGASGGPDQPLDEDPPARSSGPVGPGGAGAPDPLAAEAAELRRLIDAGAGTPEELRALAARLREHRQREEAVWRSAVKPQLVKQGRGRLRRQPPPDAPSLPALGHPVPPPAGTAPDTGSRSLWLGLGLLAMVAIAVVAARTTVWVLVLPVLALLGWAWSQGRDAAP